MTKNETKTFIQLQQYNKAVYYTKILCVIFHQSKSSDVYGGWKITSYSLLFTHESSYCFQHVLAIAILSVCLSVHPSVTRVDQSKTV